MKNTTKLGTLLLIAGIVLANNTLIAAAAGGGAVVNKAAIAAAMRGPESSAAKIIVTKISDLPTLHRAAYDGNIDHLKTALDSGADINATFDMTRRDGQQDIDDLMAGLGI